MISFCCPLFRFFCLFFSFSGDVAASPQCQIGFYSCSCPVFVSAGAHSFGRRRHRQSVFSSKGISTWLRVGVGGRCTGLQLLFFSTSSALFGPLAVAVDQEVRCPDCPIEFADHVSADWFQRLCLINGVEWSFRSCRRVHGGHDGGEQHLGPMLWTIRSHCLSRSILLFPWGGFPFLQ